jgi:hypothetical protein
MLSENNVTTALSIVFVSDFIQGFYHVPAGNAGKDTHAFTSTNSSVIGGGIASSCALKLSR